MAKDSTPFPKTPPKVLERFATPLELTMINLLEQNQNQIQSLTHQVTNDTLTKINNSNYWEAIIPILEKDGEHAFAIISLDIDLLKATNDTFTHDNGNKLLQEAAIIIKKTFRENDIIITRKGGDEFAVALPMDPKILEKAYEEFKIDFQKDHPKDSTVPTFTQFASTYVSNLINNRLQKEITEFNQNLEPDEIPLQISYGSAISLPNKQQDRPHNLNAIFFEADQSMYHMKAEHKQSILSAFTPH